MIDIKTTRILTKPKLKKQTTKKQKTDKKQKRENKP